MVIEYYKLQAKQVGSYGTYLATSPLYGDKLKRYFGWLLHSGFVAAAEGRSQKRQGFLTAEDRERAFWGAISSFSVCFWILTAIGPRKSVKFELHSLNLGVLLFVH
jgi:hypothetical protein